MPEGFAKSLLQFVRDYGFEHVEYENPFNRDLNRAFGGKGRQYPAGTRSGRCDAVIPVAGHGDVWVEVKVGWTYFDHQQFERNNSHLFEKHMFTTSERETSFVNDITRKLATLDGHPDVASFGELLILRYSELYPLPPGTLDRLRGSAGIGNLPWREYCLGPWRDSRLTATSGSIEVYYWERENRS